MAGRLLTLSAKALRAPNVRLGAACYSDMSPKSIIGTREVVGYGFNGEPNYMDRSDFPMPAIRWKEVTPDVNVSILKFK